MKKFIVKIIILIVVCVFLGNVSAENAQASIGVQVEGYVVFAHGNKTYENLLNVAKQSLVSSVGCGNVKSVPLEEFAKKRPQFGFAVPTPEKIYFDKCQNIAGLQLDVIPNGLVQLHTGTYRTILNGMTGQSMSVPNYDCVEPDKCLNINGNQMSVPAGFKDVGGRICQLNASAGFNIFCRPAKINVKPGESAGFVATPFYKSAGLVKYEWYNGASATGNPVATYNVGGVSTHYQSFENQGNYQMTVVATDSKNKRVSCTTGVTVTSDEALLNNTGANKYDGAAAINFGGDKPLTNDTCKLTWNASNVIECFLTNVQGMSDKVSLSGTKDVEPGAYRLLCISNDAKPIYSSEFVCRENLNFREI